MMDRRQFATRLALAAACGLQHSFSKAQESMADDEPSTGPVNAIGPTLGGKQFWADELFFHEWHIQRNVFTGHCRLLDGYRLRHAWGTFAECRQKLEEIKQRRGLPPMAGRSVIVLHGLFRTPSAMDSLCQYLHQEGGYSVFNVSYPTTRASVAVHAWSLSSIIKHLDGIEEINFVGHSLGNLVVRHYLSDHTDPTQGLRPDARINRFVMLGPPNQGAEIAEAFRGVKLFHAVAGTSGTELASQWDELEANLAIPDCEFGILAGGRSNSKGFNPFLSGDDDLVVGVDATRLPGARDFCVLPVMHSFMMNDPTVQEYTLRFLKHGYFVSAESRRPIAADDEQWVRRGQESVKEKRRKF